MAEPPPPASERGRERSLSRSMLHRDLNMLQTYAARYPSQRSVDHPGSHGRSGSRSHGRSSSRTYRAASPMSTRAADGGGRSHERRSSNLISSNNHSAWNTDSIESLQGEMEAAMAGMLYQYTKRVNQEMQFYDELEATATANPEFAKPERAISWTIKEVCWWLIKLHLEKYAKTFSELGIDGNILLYDIDEDILEREVGIRPLHMRKLMRELNKLRKVNEVESKVLEAASASESELVLALRAELEEQRRVNNELRHQLLQYRQASRR